MTEVLDDPLVVSGITILTGSNIILENCGKINPESIEDYLQHGGYQSLQKCLHMTPDEVIAIIKNSKLRGRGGAGFPTGLKWEFCRKAPGNKKYVIINADEGDPGAFMDRALLETDPHSVLEGFIIGGYAIGASHGIIYIRAEYPIAIRRFQQTLAAAKERGYLGEDILGSGFSFDVEIQKGAGAFVCGEETALIASIEGKRGHPRSKPPFPANQGLWNQPTNINNVKTWASIPKIIRMGWEAFREIGTPDCPGTAIFSLAGKISRTGLLEVPMGTTLREIVFDVGKGVPNNKQIKAIQTGGPSGGCIPVSLLDTPVDFDTLAAVGSIMGSGGMVVLDEDVCIVDFAKFFLSFTQKESCGKCVPCREGTLRCLEILERITSGKGKLQDLDDLENLGQVIIETSLCGLGQTAPNPLRSTLKHFRAEYLEHIEQKSCRAGICKGMFTLEIIDDLCNDCGRCQNGCSFDAVIGSKEEGYYIKDNICEGCRICYETCPKQAIRVIPK